jgi:hypothetical protein
MILDGIIESLWCVTNNSLTDINYKYQCKRFDGESRYDYIYYSPLASIRYEKKHGKTRIEYY